MRFLIFAFLVTLVLCQEIPQAGIPGQFGNPALPSIPGQPPNINGNSGQQGIPGISGLPGLLTPPPGFNGQLGGLPNGLNGQPGIPAGSNGVSNPFAVSRKR
ncbi:unnamed protein product [Bursaphelenchus xylophilus]|nr:unnamed protein product [Bursaphelenchus xylophilus]CAG9130772.1 unnamed protein product [Bursaphelenchus xylophilus]